MGGKLYVFRRQQVFIADLPIWRQKSWIGRKPGDPDTVLRKRGGEIKIGKDLRGRRILSRDRGRQHLHAGFKNIIDLVLAVGARHHGNIQGDRLFRQSVDNNAVRFRAPSVAVPGKDPALSQVSLRGSQEGRSKKKEDASENAEDLGTPFFCALQKRGDHGK